MKRKICEILLGILIILIILISYFKITNSNKKTDDLTKLKIAEVTHSAFYAPLYAAKELGYFKDNGIDIELILTSGADKVAAAVLSNDVEIGFAGPESAIYVYNGGEEDYLVTFAGLTKRDGQFIVSREKITNFTLNDLKNENVDSKSININTSIEFAALSGTFVAGVGDFVNLFEPNATNLVKQGYGYIVGNIGAYSGEVPYTAFYARKSFLNNNEDTLKKFTKALNQGLTYVRNNSPETIAQTILPQFPDISLTDLTTIVDNYKTYDSWLDNPYITEESYKNLEDIMLSDNLIDDYVPYNELIKNLYNE